MAMSDHIVSFHKLDNDQGIGHVIKSCLVQQFVWILLSKATQVRELGFLRSVFGDKRIGVGNRGWYARIWFKSKGPVVICEG